MNQEQEENSQNQEVYYMLQEYLTQELYGNIFKAQMKTIELALGYAEIVLSQIGVTEKLDLVLIAGTAFQLAYKQEEVYCLSFSDFIKYTNSSFSIQEYANMEVYMVKKLRWKTCLPTSIECFGLIKQLCHLDWIYQKELEYMISMCNLEESLKDYLPSSKCFGIIVYLLGEQGENQEENFASFIQNQLITFKDQQQQQTQIYEIEQVYFWLFEEMKEIKEREKKKERENKSARQEIIEDSQEIQSDEDQDSENNEQEEGDQEEQIDIDEENNQVQSLSTQSSDIKLGSYSQSLQYSQDLKQNLSDKFKIPQEEQMQEAFGNIIHSVQDLECSEVDC